MWYGQHTTQNQLRAVVGIFVIIIVHMMVAIIMMLLVMMIYESFIMYVYAGLNVNGGEFT